MFSINGVEISKNKKPFLVAELSANHDGSIDRAKQTIKAAKKAGISAVKIQTYTPDTMTINSSKSDFQIKDGLWKGQNLYELYEKAHTPFEWHEELFDFSRRIGLTIFSTPFDETAVDLLESLGSPAYKIASFEIIDLPLIKYVAEKGKPMLLSTGMASKDEVSQALEVINETGNSQVLLFHCVSSYPTPTEQSNLSKAFFQAHYLNFLG